MLQNLSKMLLITEMAKHNGDIMLKYELSIVRKYHLLSFKLFNFDCLKLFFSYACILSSDIRALFKFVVKVRLPLAQWAADINV